MMAVTFKMDSIDQQIIEKLQRHDAPRTRNEMAGALGVSPATVRRHVRKLVEAGIVSIPVLVDPEKLGLPVAAVIGLRVHGDRLETVTETLKRSTAITWLMTCIGRFDMIAVARFSSIGSLRDFLQRDLRAIEGISDIETFLCVDEKKSVRVTR